MTAAAPGDGPGTDDESALLVTERETDEGLLVAVCDGDLLGKTFEDGPVSITVTEEFYAGEPADTDAAIETLSRADVANLVGTRTVELAVDEGFVDEDNVLEIGATLHAQFLRLG